MSARYALYFSPAEDSALWRFGSAVLGRHPGAVRSANSSSAFHDLSRWRSLTQKPAHYGFHATLKAPFELAKDMSEAQLLAAADAFSSNQPALPLLGLAPRRLSHFLALTLDAQPAILGEFAQNIVEHFDSFRKPMSEADRQRRLAQELTLRQVELLQQFGYPYVAEEFRFHMTLSGVLSAADSDFEHWVKELYGQMVSEQSALDQLAVFKQPDRQRAFVQSAVYPLRASDR